MTSLLRFDQIHGVPPLKEEYLFFSENPFLPHEEGKGLRDKIEGGLEEIYALLQAKKEDSFVFTSSGEEAVSQVMYHFFLEVVTKTGKNQIVSSNGEIASLLNGKGKASSLGGVARDIALNHEGVITKEAYLKVLTPRTGLFSFSLVNPLTGVIQPLEEIMALSKERGVLVHIDVTHAIGKINLSLEELNADFVTFSGESIGAPLGTGALFIPKRNTVTPLILGGYDQGGLRGGPYNPILFCMFAKACDRALKKLDHVLVDVAHLRYHFEKNLEMLIPESAVLFKEQERVPNITLLHFPGIFQENFFYYLSQKGLFSSMGGGAFLTLPYFLQEIPGMEEKAFSSLNFSFSDRITKEEIEKGAKIITEGYQFLLQEEA